LKEKDWQLLLPVFFLSDFICKTIAFIFNRWSARKLQGRNNDKDGAEAI